jgi:non-specific protein-tyrosine kinase
MSRIQNLLNKAERDGQVRRTRALADEGIVLPPMADARDSVGPSIAPPPPGPPPPAAPTFRRIDVLDSPPSGPTASEPTWPSDDPAVGPGGRLDPRLIAALAPASLAAEQFRSLRARLRRAENGRATRTIAITSPGKGDGKSLTAANLALTMSQEFQQRVLLLDGDLRRPSVHLLFGLREGPGLSDVLVGASALEDTLITLPDHNLTVVPAGIAPAHPTELLGSAAMRRIVDTLRSRYDKILIDMPPVAPLADLHVIAPMVDGLLMVVRAGVTPKPAIERALAGLELSKVLGLVLNDSAGPNSDDDTYGGYRYIAG